MAGSRPARDPPVRALLLWLALVLPAAAQTDCGGAVDACRTANGTYRILLPEAAAGAPAVMFLHGAGGNGGGALKLGRMTETLLGRGYAVIAPDGQARPGRRGRFWSFRADVGGTARDEAAFLAEVVRDAAGRHGVDGGRVLLAGFSNGAFLVNYLACAEPEAFGAYAPIAGGFWRPLPAGCAGPVRLLHTHGWRDATVPLEGRPLRGGRWVQGDIFAGLAIWRRANGCARDAPTGYGEGGGFQRRRWSCDTGAALELALHPGGHGVPPGWATMALDWFEALDGG